MYVFLKYSTADTLEGIISEIASAAVGSKDWEDGLTVLQDFLEDHSMSGADLARAMIRGGVRYALTGGRSNYGTDPSAPSGNRTKPAGKPGRVGGEYKLDELIVKLNNPYFPCHPVGGGEWDTEPVFQEWYDGSAWTSSVLKVTWNGQPVPPWFDRYLELLIQR